jgi:hypothetical protein
MQGEGPLLAIAEISVALAGFTSVVITLRGPGAEAWSKQDRVGLANVLGASVGTMLGSLVPFPLEYLGWSDAAVWGVANAFFGLLVLGASASLAYAVLASQAPPRAPRMFWSFVGSGLLIGAMLLLAAFDRVVPRGAALLLLGLVWALLAAFGQLAAFVLVSGSGRP